MRAKRLSFLHHWNRIWLWCDRPEREGKLISRWIIAISSIVLLVAGFIASIIIVIIKDIAPTWTVIATLSAMVAIPLASWIHWAIKDDN